MKALQIILLFTSCFVFSQNSVYPYLDSDSNGLTWLAKKLHGQKIIGHITLSQGERSDLAELAADLL